MISLYISDNTTGMDSNYTNEIDHRFSNISVYLNATGNISGSGRQLNRPIFISSGPLFDDVSDKYMTSVLLPSLVYVSFLLLVGIPGNLMVIYVYSLKWRANTSRVFILALGSYDFINCVTSLTTEIVLLSRFLNFDFPVWCKVSRFLSASINSGSTFILVAIATDRFLRICKIHKDPISVELARSLVFISVFFAALTSWPVLLLYGSYTVIIPLKPPVFVKGKTCLVSDSMVETMYPLIFVIFLLSAHFLVDIVLIALYSFVGRVIYHQQAFRKSMIINSSIKNSTKPVNKSDGSNSNFTVDELEEHRPALKEAQPEKNNRVSIVFWKKLSLEYRRSKVQKNPSSQKKKVIKELKQSLKGHPSIDSNTAKSGSKFRAGRTTFMLFLVTVLFILSFLPYSVLVIVRYTDPGFYTRLTSGGKAVYNVFLRSYLLNSVVNPLVYCFVSKEFRSRCKDVIHSLVCYLRD